MHCPMPGAYTKQSETKPKTEAPNKVCKETEK